MLIKFNKIVLFGAGLKKIFVHGVPSVSYTHLDVYKRQLYILYYW